MSSPRLSSKEEELLRSVERAIERSYAAKQATNVPLWRRLLGNASKKSKNDSAALTTAPPSPGVLVGTQREEQERAKEGADVASSAPRHPSEAGAEGDDVQPAAQDRSVHAATMMKSALARIQGGQNSGAFVDMELAMKGLMDVSFKGRERVPVLPAEFRSKWPHGNVRIIDCSAFLSLAHAAFCLVSLKACTIHLIWNHLKKPMFNMGLLRSLWG